MASKLPSTLIKDFSKLINERQTNPTPQYLKGTAKISGDKKYVQIDGSSSLTPIAETVDIQEGDRVLVSIENHKATVLGNFTFPPNARKEQEAVDKADEAITDSNVALENATEAKENAAAAMENASAAQSSATEAIGKAENAMENVKTAITKAETAISDASNAKELANQAADKATESLESVSAAQNEIDQIQNEVGTVQEDINQALTDLAEQAGEIETIQTNLSTNYATKTELGTVEAELNQTITSSISELSTSISQTYAAKTDVVEMTGELQTQITQNTESISSQASKIETIEADTAAAQEAVEEAKSAASQAQTIANEAKTNANTAIANAATAQSAANKAQEDADAAAQAASTAQQKADAADQAVQQAQNDLAEAEANLASVTTRVDATEEEIVEAQQAVEQAQQEVDQALADAATANYAAQQAAQAAQTAQDTADTAKTNAEYAQTAADNAQAAADNAQAAADQAQEDVAALTQRVTTAETNIEQNAEQISLNASKTEEIGNLLENNYYSKEETEAAIDVAADQITSEVTSTVETTVKEEIEKIEVGARNLLLNSSFNINLDNWNVATEQEAPVDISFYTEGLIYDILEGSIKAPAGDGVLSTFETWTLKIKLHGNGEGVDMSAVDNGTAGLGISIKSNQTGSASIAFKNFKVESVNDEDAPPGYETSTPSIATLYEALFDGTNPDSISGFLPTGTGEIDPDSSYPWKYEKSSSNFSVIMDGTDPLSIGSNCAQIYGGGWLIDDYFKTYSYLPYADLVDKYNLNGIDTFIISLDISTNFVPKESSITIYTNETTNITSGHISSGPSAAIYQDVSPRLSIEDAAKIYTISGDFKLDNYVASETSKAELFFKGNSSATKPVNLIKNNFGDFDGTNERIPFEITGPYDFEGETTSELVPITVTTQSGLADLTQYFGKGWVESKWTVELSGIPNYLTTNEYLDVGVRVFDFVGDLYFKNLKLEKGNKMTDWTPAPEDQEDQLEDAILENNETVRQNYTSLINQQADRISALISRVDSTEDSLSSIETSVSNKIEITEEDISLIKETITTLEDAVNGQMSVQELIEWIRIEGASMTLGKSDSKIVGKLTNDRLTFMNGDKEVAYFSAEGMYVFQAIIAKQLTCGAYSWVDEEELGFSLV